MREELLPLCKPTIGAGELAEVEAVLKSGWLTSGPRVKELEQAVAAYTGARHAIAVSSGTAALHCAYAAIEPVAGRDEIIMPSLTWPSTAHMALASGFRVKFADIDPHTLQIDPEWVKAIFDRERTAAIVPVHFAGAAAPLVELKTIAEESDPPVPIIEDAAHAIGTRYRQGSIGWDSYMACLSFHPIKNMTTGEGGMLLTDDDTVAKFVRLFRFHGIDRDAWSTYKNAGKSHYNCDRIGFKYNLTDLAAALGIHQLHNLDGFITRRTEIASYYLENLQGLEGVKLPRVPKDTTRHAWHLFTILAEDRDELMDQLRYEGIGTGLHFEAAHRLNCYKLSHHDLLPATDYVCSRIMSLPLFPQMRDEDAEDVVAAIRKYRP